MKKYIVLAVLLLDTVAYGAALKSPTATTPKSPQKSITSAQQPQQFTFQTKKVSVQSKDDVIRDLKDQNKHLQAQVDRYTKQMSQQFVIIKRLETDLKFARNTIHNLRNQLTNSQRPMIAAPTSPRHIPQPPNAPKPAQQKSHPVNPRIRRVQQQSLSAQ